MKEILVIQEGGLIIGVASDQSKAVVMIGDYYGEDCKIVEVIDVRDSGIEFICKVYDSTDKYTTTVTVHYFTIDEI